jgi:hypothetical protein
MPGLVEECFTAAGTTMADHVDIRPVDPMYRSCYADGSVLQATQATQRYRLGSVGQVVSPSRYFCIAEGFTF